jgi:hypothetical protein
MYRGLTFFPVSPAFAACPESVLTKTDYSTATVSWAAPTKNTNGSPITGPLEFNVYDMRGTPTLLVGHFR